MKIILIVAIVLAALTLWISSRPSKFLYARSILIDAPAEKIFPEINDLRRWAAWSPFAKMDPAAHYEFEGPVEGVGAINHWDGKKAGKGSMVITESLPFELIQFRLDFLKPLKATNITEFTLQPENGQTRVTWSMQGNINFVGKAMGLVMDCEKMCGDMFSRGLADLKDIAER